MGIRGGAAVGSASGDRHEPTSGGPRSQGPATRARTFIVQKRNRERGSRPPAPVPGQSFFARLRNRRSLPRETPSLSAAAVTLPPGGHQRGLDHLLGQRRLRCPRASPSTSSSAQRRRPGSGSSRRTAARAASSSRTLLGQGSSRRRSTASTSTSSARERDAGAPRELGTRRRRRPRVVRGAPGRGCAPWPGARRDRAGTRRAPPSPRGRGWSRRRPARRRARAAGRPPAAPRGSRAGGGASPGDRDRARLSRRGTGSRRRAPRRCRARRCGASENAPATWPNICDSKTPRASAGHVDGGEGLLAPERRRRRARDELLARRPSRPRRARCPAGSGSGRESGSVTRAQAVRADQPADRRRRLEAALELLAEHEEGAAEPQHRAVLEGREIARREPRAVDPRPVARAGVGDAQRAARRDRSGGARPRPRCRRGRARRARRGRRSSPSRAARAPRAAGTRTPAPDVAARPPASPGPGARWCWARPSACPTGRVSRARCAR